MTRYTVQEAASRSGWSPRMLRYLEEHGLLTPERTAAGYRLYHDRDVERLAALRRLRDLHAFGLDDLAFALRLRREPFLAKALDAWLESGREALAPSAEEDQVLSQLRDDAWLRFEQQKHERLIVA